jgi:hypothetical protein
MRSLRERDEQLRELEVYYWDISNYVWQRNDWKLFSYKYDQARLEDIQMHNGLYVFLLKLWPFY